MEGQMREIFDKNCVVRINNEKPIFKRVCGFEKFVQ
jgi:hypothetical protein